MPNPGNDRLLEPANCGFVKEPPYVMNFLMLPDKTVHHEGEGESIKVSYLDFSSAFGSGSHFPPVRKLPVFGIIGSSRKCWAVSTNCSFRSRVANCESESENTRR